MDPIQTCELLLSSLKQSNLNFHLIESPFSVKIEIKKSFIRNQNGAIRSSGLAPNPKLSLEVEKKVLEDTIAKNQVYETKNNKLQLENTSLLTQLSELQLEFDSLKVDMGQFQIEQEISEKKKANLGNICDEKKSEIVLLKKSLKAQEGEKVSLKDELSKLNKHLKSKEKEIYRLETKVENISSNSKAFKSEVSKLKKEKNNLEKELTKEVSKPKISQKVTAEPAKQNQLNSILVSNTTPSHSSPTISSISTSSNTEFKPLNTPPSYIKSLPIPSTTTFSTTSINHILTTKASKPTTNATNALPITPNTDSTSSSTPVFKNFSREHIKPVKLSANYTPGCPHAPQCVVRQPHHPPPEMCTVMQHPGSKYHELVASETGVPTRYHTHDYCMRIEYKNYGCDNCIWYKWWGELHGYPDINPWSFREHLQPVTFL